MHPQFSQSWIRVGIQSSTVHIVKTKILLLIKERKTIGSGSNCFYKANSGRIWSVFRSRIRICNPAMDKVGQHRMT